MHALTRIIEKVPHDPLMIAFLGGMAVLIVSVIAMWIVTTVWSRAERRGVWPLN